MSNLPIECFCPISKKIMKEPVVLEDGYTYEKVEIISWLMKNNNRSPVNGKIIISDIFYPNKTLKNLIQSLLNLNIFTK